MDTRNTPLPVKRALKKLGQDLRDARKRRRITVELAAERATMSRATLTKIEKGDDGVSLGAYAKILFVLGMIERLVELADPRFDTLGLGLEADNLPKRIRISRKEKGEEWMEQVILVYVDLMGTPIKVGHLWGRFRNGRESMSFEYDRNWLNHPKRFSLDPALKLVAGSFHAASDKPLFGAIDDSAPDRWGRLLMRRSERKSAEHEKRTARALREIDFLLMVDDEGRQGALRFKREEQGTFLTSYDKNHIPPLVAVGKLLTAASHVIQDSDTEEDLRLLLAPGSSLGGARPKSSVRDKDGHLTIAKFPRKDDEINVIAWEAVALSLANKAGIKVPDWRIETIGRQQILLSRRFDRKKDIRIPFLSAMSVLAAKDNEMHSYLEIADAIRQMSASPKEDLEALWRRIVFNVLISNVDDHLRNHAFLYSGLSGWRLSPAYDLNPTPTDIKPRILSTAIDLIDPNASLDVAVSVAHYFELDNFQAKKISNEVGSATALWREEATKLKIKKTEIDRMASAFEHEDLQKSLQ